MLSNLDIFLAVGVMILSLYGLKRYCDAKKRRDEAEANRKFPHAHSSRSPYREYKNRNRAVNFFIMPFFIAVVYTVLRLTGTIGSIFS